MKGGCVVVMPVGLLVLLSGFLTMNNEIDPEDITLRSDSDYQLKAKRYAETDRKQEALDTCAAIEVNDISSESAQEHCFLDVYDITGDIDGEISIYEKWYEYDRANGHSGDGPKRSIEILKEKKRER